MMFANSRFPIMKKQVRNTGKTTVSDCGKSFESVQLAMLKACDACADMGQ